VNDFTTEETLRVEFSSIPKHLFRRLEPASAISEFSAISRMISSASSCLPSMQSASPLPQRPTLEDGFVRRTFLNSLSAMTGSLARSLFTAMVSWAGIKLGFNKRHSRSNLYDVSKSLSEAQTPATAALKPRRYGILAVRPTDVWRSDFILKVDISCETIYCQCFC